MKIVDLIRDIRRDLTVIEIDSMEQHLDKSNAEAALVRVYQLLDQVSKKVAEIDT